MTAFFCAVCSVPSFAQASDPPVLASRSAVLFDATTGKLLYEKDADEVIPPASLTKLMSMFVVLDDVAAGRLSLSDIVDLPRSTWAASQPWGSSLMFLAPGQTVTLGELMLGLAVSSGNDAAIAVALHVAGSVEAFAGRMNLKARELGLQKTRFTEPSGYSELNLTTAREFGSFCVAYIRAHPEALRDFHSVREFAYPKAENQGAAFRDDPGTVVQSNRNLLLGEFEGVDGLKTGFIIESGYNIALTAERKGTRLLAVLLGGPGASSSRGGRIRADDGAVLLDWGFDRFKTVRPVVENLEATRVWKGRSRKLGVVPAGPLAFTAPADRALSVSWEVRRNPWVVAPVRAGDELGSIVFSDGGGELHRVPLAAAESVPRGNVFVRFFDSIALFFMKLFS
ncbi:MAG TPA: D-alanyl-D-alanine carboxypeptidase [Treponema sp.]|nr:MAG: hypothetical protein A2001_14850 [Treponema sp. GWC1_61_84]OHE76095.1 MAG: hypothetical protein A2413_13820 [Treponema sp. RIFOXYC1_FULL_61_9]HCM25981.1 D-alanyl-D-alanine carboxypeptidase [Treponema sp.]